MKFAAPIRRGLLSDRRKRGERTLKLEVLEPRRVFASLPYGAMPRDTGEFMLGRIAVTPVLLESNGQIDPSSENWNEAHIDQVLSKLDEGLEWWQQLLATKSSVHTLDFVIDRTYADQPVQSAYEPIHRVSNDYDLWTQEFLARAGFNQSFSLEENMRAFNEAQRQKANADWSFTVFVVNSQLEGDGTFAAGGSFSRAFAFAGGLFFVTPSTRPASTFAHETGHMFWARDEYAGGGSYYAQRGYYSTQNSNAVDGNPDLNFQQAPSIMAAGHVLDTAYTNLVSPASTLAMIGWQDSDADGVFDVLDVPLLLDGVGRVDVTTGNYRFVGTAKVQTLPNRNPSGLGNDITLNKISRIEASIDGGPWQSVAQPDLYEAALDLSIPIGGRSNGTLRLRAIDQATGITSNIFEGEIGALPDATPVAGINGFVWNDANANGLFDPVESGLGGQVVRLVDQNGQPLNLQRAVEPDAQVPGVIASTAYAGVLLSAIGPDTNGNLGVFNDTAATTGAKVFRPYSVAMSGFANGWSQRRQLKIEFALPTSYVSADIIGTGPSYGRLELYNANGELLERATTAELSAGQSQRLELGRPTADIAYAIVRGHLGAEITIDNISYGPKTQTTTDASGRYRFPHLPAGNYDVQFVLSSAVSQVTSPAGATQEIALQSLQSAEHVDFGINYQSSQWHNRQLAADVNGDGFSTAIDALLVINLINQGTGPALIGSTVPPTLYVDVSNDAFVTPLDALMVINAINSRGDSGEGDDAENASAPRVTASAQVVTESPAAEGELAMFSAGAPAIERTREESAGMESSQIADAPTVHLEGEANAETCSLAYQAVDEVRYHSLAQSHDHAAAVDSLLADDALTADLNASAVSLVIDRR